MIHKSIQAHIKIFVHATIVATGNLNKDDNITLVVANDGTSNVTILFGDGHGSFGTENPVQFNQYPRTVSIEDFNNDNNLDLLVTTQKNVGIGINNVYVVHGQFQMQFNRLPSFTCLLVKCGRFIFWP